MAGVDVDLNDLIARVINRLSWLDQKCEIYDNEINIQLKIVDQYNKTLASLLKLLQFRNLNGEDPYAEMLNLLSEESEDLVQKA